MSLADIEALAADLAARAGRQPPLSLTALSGGRNNRVFRLEMPDGLPLALKLYHRDDRDRLGHEWSFLSHAWDIGVRCVPRPLARDSEAGAVVCEFVEGRKPHADEVDAGLVDQALDFVLGLNAPPRRIAHLPAAAEACFSLADHLAQIDRRVKRLSGQAALAEEAARFVKRDLAPAWRAVRGEVQAAADLSPALAAPLADSAICLSPSDFGFHNALLHEDRLTFLDFEYAGRDDPAKLACDFFCQPETPAPLALQPALVERLTAGLGLSEVDRDRCHLLLAPYRVKWICIILNEFLPMDAARRTFAGQEVGADRLAAQLTLARRKLDELQSNSEGIHLGLS